MRDDAGENCRAHPVVVQEGFETRRALAPADQPLLVDEQCTGNAQSQPKFTWPAAVPVARAYLQQMVRARRILDERAEEVSAILKRVEAGSASAQQLHALAAKLRREAEAIRAQTLGGDAERMSRLADVISGLAG